MQDTYFPFQEVRKTQDSFIKEIVDSIDKNENLLGHVPTGVGKTVSALASTLYKYKDKDVVIFFLTPRHSQHKLAIETLKLIKTKFNLDFTAVDLIGKKNMCLFSGTQLLTSGEFHEYCREVREKEICEFYVNFKNKDFQTKRKIFLDSLSKKSPLDVEELVEESSLAGFCPYEISAEMCKKAKIIVADYFHLLSPGVRKALFSRIDKKLSQCVLILDEAHNLPSRCRDLLSSNLSTFLIDLSINESKKYGFKLEDDLNEIKNILLKLAKRMNIKETEILVKKEDFNFQGYSELIDHLEDAAEKVREKQKRSFLGVIANSLTKWKGEDKGFTRILSKGFLKSGKGNITLNYKCLDPSFITKELIEESKQVIGMSGTLLPLDMYKDLLGFENVKLVEYESPFPKENRLNLIVPSVTTKFTKRDKEMYKKIAVSSANVVNKIPGNSIVFFPSYYLRDVVYEYFQKLSNKTIFLEHAKYSKAERDELLNKFKRYKDSGAVLLAVSSGSFGEGIDLMGDYLKGVLVVGIPLAKSNLETKELIRYYEDRFSRGWDYAYIYPAIIKSIQNAGRCIRSETDKGVMVFLDERYKWNNYKKCFGDDHNLKITLKPEDYVSNFFN